MSRVPGQTIQIRNARRRRQRIGLALVSATAGALAIASPLAAAGPPSPPFNAEGAGAASKDVAPPPPPISATQVIAGATNTVDVSAATLSDLGNLVKTAAPLTDAGPAAPCTSPTGKPVDPSECGMKIKPQDHDPPPLTVLPNGNPVFNPDYLVDKIADRYGVSRSAVTTAAASTAGKCGVGMVWGSATTAVRAAFPNDTRTGEARWKGDPGLTKAAILTFGGRRKQNRQGCVAASNARQTSRGSAPPGRTFQIPGSSVAQEASPARVWRPVRRISSSTWRLTALRLIESDEAMSALVRPCATSPSTSRWRCVSRTASRPRPFGITRTTGRSPLPTAATTSRSSSGP